MSDDLPTHWVVRESRSQPGKEYHHKTSTLETAWVRSAAEENATNPKKRSRDKNIAGRGEQQLTLLPPLREGELPPLHVGDIVKMFGLSRRPDLNGQQGKLRYLHTDRAGATRWRVQLDSAAGTVVDVREENLVDAAGYDTDEGWVSSRVARRRPNKPLTVPQNASQSSSLPEFFLPNPPSPPREFMLAKQAERVKAPGRTGISSHMRDFGQREHNALVHQCSLAEPYEALLDDRQLSSDGWVATEKFDGCRAIWDPMHADGPGFRSRSGAHWVPPSCFAALLPQDMRLDGELWAGRRNFAQVLGLISSRSLDGGRWHGIAWQSLTYVVFDAPFAGSGALGYLDRLDRARERLAGMPRSDRVVVVPTMPVANAAVKDDLLKRVIDAGGEGLVLRRVSARWSAGSSKSRDILKVKHWLDAEAVVLDNKPAPSTSNVPTVLCRILNAPHADTSGTFELTRAREGSQLTPGTILTFCYRQISKTTGQPSVAGGGPRIRTVHDPATCDCCYCNTSCD